MSFVGEGKVLGNKHTPPDEIDLISRVATFTLLHGKRCFDSRVFLVTSSALFVTGGSRFAPLLFPVAVPAGDVEAGHCLDPFFVQMFSVREP